MHHHNGFSLIELIMVLILIGTLSVVGMGIFASKDDFSASKASAVFISFLSLAQQRALVIPDGSTTLTIAQTASQWQLSFTGFDTTIQRDNASLSIDGNALTDGSSVTIAYDNTAALTKSYSFTFSANNSVSLCVSQTGFAYSGTCQP